MISSFEMRLKEIFRWVPIVSFTSSNLFTQESPCHFHGIELSSFPPYSKELPLCRTDSRISSSLNKSCFNRFLSSVTSNSQHRATSSSIHKAYLSHFNYFNVTLSGSHVLYRVNVNISKNNEDQFPSLKVKAYKNIFSLRKKKKEKNPK